MFYCSKRKTTWNARNIPAQKLAAENSSPDPLGQPGRGEVVCLSVCVISSSLLHQEDGGLRLKRGTGRVRDGDGRMGN